MAERRRTGSTFRLLSFAGFSFSPVVALGSGVYGADAGSSDGFRSSETGKRDRRFSFSFGRFLVFAGHSGRWRHL
jgi:hypothetical protein